MSWSVSAVGKPRAVAAKLAEDFNRIKCSEPEESIKNSAASAIAAALSAMPDEYAVRVEANGSQSPFYGKDQRVVPGKFLNNLSVRLDPLYGFVE